MKIKMSYDSIISYGILLSIPLSVYPITSSGITIGDVLLFIVLTISLLEIKKNDNKIKFFIPIYIYILMILILSLIHFELGMKDYTTSIFGVIRYIFYLVVCLVIPNNGFNANKAYKLYKIISILIAIYVIMQFLSYNIFKIILPINVLGLRTFERVYISDSVNNYLTIGKFYRPSGIFIEPAHYAAYQAPILYMIFNNTFDNNRFNKVISCLIILSLFLTGSTLGIVIVLYLFIKPIIKVLKTNFFKSLFFIACVTIMLTLFLNTNYGKSIFNRTFSDESNGAINGRFGNINTIFNNEKNIIIGNGLSSNIGYLPSYPYLILCYGIVGVGIFVVVVITSYFKCTKTGKEILILFLFISIGTLSLFGNYIILYFAFAFSKIGIKNRKNINNSNSLVLY